MIYKIDARFAIAREQRLYSYILCIHIYFLYGLKSQLYHSHFYSQIDGQNSQHIACFIPFTVSIGFSVCHITIAIVELTVSCCHFGLQTTIEPNALSVIQFTQNLTKKKQQQQHNNICMQTTFEEQHTNFTLAKLTSSWNK